MDLPGIEDLSRPDVTEDPFRRGRLLRNLWPPAGTAPCGGLWLRRFLASDGGYSGDPPQVRDNLRCLFCVPNGKDPVRSYERELVGSTGPSTTRGVEPTVQVVKSDRQRL